MLCFKLKKFFISYKNEPSIIYALSLARKVMDKDFAMEDFKAHDEDGDGAITYDEYLREQGRYFMFYQI